jgi:hypothetical protein
MMDENVGVPLVRDADAKSGDSAPVDLRRYPPSKGRMAA